MPIDVTDKQRQLAQDLTTAADEFMNAMNVLIAKRQEYQESGMDWDNDILQIGSPATMHLSDNLLDNLLGSIDNINTFLDGGDRGNLQAVRI